MPTEAEKKKAYAARILKKADELLAEVDEAYILTDTEHEKRAMALFRPEEITLGKVLGRGGFGVVNAVMGFCLDDHDNDEGESGENAEKNEDPANQSSALENRGDHSEEGGTRGAGVVEKTVRSADENQDSFHHHYDEKMARTLMTQRCQKGGTSRYALKRLHDDLTEVERARGMVDMAIEAKFLSVVWHPNIIKMRGMAKGPIVHADFFILMDRLHETLDHRIEHWFKEEKKLTGKFLGLGKRPKMLKQLLVERMTVAYDLAAAFFYLHEHRLVYRDIKPENIGFDLRGDVKVFDFGLCKSLSAKLKARDGYGYKLTGRAGSLPYMAPEVARMETYDTKCDVFSFSILLWEILALRQAFKGLTATSFMEKVVMEHGRLVIPKTFPPLTRLMIPEAWDKDPQSRPDMKRVALLIRGDLNDMTDDEQILSRTKHMINRSNHSLSGLEDD